MLRLTKSVSDENYPVTPQTSAVRKLRIRANVGNVADLTNSYLIVKNSISTTINTESVVRNVGWGASMSQENQWEYPAACQIRTASLSIGGQVVEYNEDLNVRRVNMDVYAKSAEKIRKHANMGSYGFQRLPGPKILTADATTANMHSGNYLSPFVELDEVNNATYKQVASIIYLSDVFEFCKVANDANLAGKEVLIELQFEDRNTLLTEFVNYKTQLEAIAAPTVDSVQPFDHQCLSIDPTATVNLLVPGAAPAVFDPANYTDLTYGIQITLLNKYKSLRDVPLFVDQPICVWLNGAKPAVVGSNIFKITNLSLAGTGALVLQIAAYSSEIAGAVTYIQPAAAGTAVTPAQVRVNIATAAGTNVCKFISCVNDPVVAANAVTIYTNIDAGKTSTYSVDGLELVMMEMPGATGKKQTFQFFQFMRDVDVIPTGQLTYQKTFQLDPGCAAVYAMFPCAQAVNVANTNMLSISHRSTVSEGLSWRNLLNGEALYSHDIVFSSDSDAVEPLYVHRLELAAKQMSWKLENLVQNQPWISHDGVACHAMIAEPVMPIAQPQQLAVRLNFDTNANSRTIYVYKAVIKEFTV
jgi:hypothetical protein